MLMMMDTAALSHHSTTEVKNPNSTVTSGHQNDNESCTTTESSTTMMQIAGDECESSNFTKETNNLLSDSETATNIATLLSGNNPLSGSHGPASPSNPSQLLTAAITAATVAASGNMSDLSPQDQWLAGLAPTLIQMFANQHQHQHQQQSSINSNLDLDGNSRQSLSSASSEASDTDNHSQSSRLSNKRRKQSKPSKCNEQQNQPQVGDDLQSLLKTMFANRDAPLLNSLPSQQSQQAAPVSPTPPRVTEQQAQHEKYSSALSVPTVVVEERESGEDVKRPSLNSDATVAASSNPVSLSLNAELFTSSSSAPVVTTALSHRLTPSELVNHISRTPLSSPSAVQPPHNITPSQPHGLPDMKEPNDPHQQQQLFFNMFANLQHKFSAASTNANSTSSGASTQFCPQCQCPCPSEEALQQHIEMEHSSQNLKFLQDAVAMATSSSGVAGSTPDLQKLCEQFALHQQKLMLQHDQQQQQQQQQQSNHHSENSRKRKRNSTSPSVRSVNSDVSSVSSRHSECSSNDSTKDEDIDRKLSPKDLNHNLLQSLGASSSSSQANQNNNNSPSNFNQMISLSSAVTPPPTSTPTLSHLNSSVNEPSHDRSSINTPPRGASPGSFLASNPSAAAAFASMFQSSAPNSLSPFLIQQMLNQAASGVSPMSQNAGQTPGGLTLNGVPLPPSMGMRIFNPEAYCELCNKEFCNKYFLKTHKANKHGIYTDSPGANGPEGSPMMSRTSQGGGSSPSLTGPNSQFPLPKHGSFEAGQIPSSLSHFFSQQQQQQQQNAMLSPTMMQRLSNIPLNLINLDSYCEICQKEFCNKYFLKKHKQKIHGYIYQGDTAIPPSNLAQQIAQSGPNAAQHYQQIQQIHALQAQLAQQQQGRGQNSPNSQLTESIQEQLAKVAAAAAATTTSSPFALNGNNSMFDSQQRPSTNVFNDFNVPQHSSMLEASSPFLINPETFCDVCCKEFHNKTFLQTHKLAKHSPAESNDDEEKANSNSDNQQDEQENIIEPGQRDPTTYGKAGPDLLPIFVQQVCAQASNPTASVKCTLCPQTLPNAYLVAMHKLYSHNVTFDPKKEDREEETESQRSPKGGVESAMDSDAEIESTPLGAVATDAQSDRSNDTSSTVAANNTLLTTPGQDLQKLHSMIKDLGSKTSTDDDGSLKSVCHLCKAEFDFRLILKAHLVSEHGFPPNDETAFLQMLTSTALDSEKNHQILQQYLSPPSPDTTCDVCFKEFRSKQFLRQHKQKIHGIGSIDVDSIEKSPANNNNNSSLMTHSALLSSFYQMQKNHPHMPQSLSSQPVPQVPGQNFSSNFPPMSMPKPAPPRSVITGRNYCNICNKELCNKYFMKTHMLKMHNINIDEHPNISDTSTIGGVTCDICQKELCSKYFLKVHKQNTHGIYEDTNGQMMLGSSYKSKQANKVSAAAAAAAQQHQHHSMHSQHSSQIMPPPPPSSFNGSGALPPMPPPGDMGAFNPMLLMSMMQQAAAAAAASEKDSNNSLENLPEGCQLCERRFKHSKQLKAHLLTDHLELMAMMRSTGEIGQAIANTTGASVEHLSKLCMVCGQSCSDRLAMNIHIVKEHKVTPEELALGLAGNIKMAAFLAAAATASAAAEHQNQESNNSERDSIHHGASSPRQTATPISRMSTPNSASSPRATPFLEDQLDQLKRHQQKSANNNGNALQDLILKNPGLLQNPMALMAAAAQTHPEIMAQFLAGLNQSEQTPAPTSGATTPKHDKDEKPPGRFVCHVCQKVYRHSHSLHRHQLSHKKEEVSAANAAAHSNSAPTDKTLSPPKRESLNGDNKPKNKRYRCSKCNKKFRTRELCLVHIRSIHSNTAPSDCEPKNKSDSVQLPPSPSASSEDLNNADQRPSSQTDFNTTATTNNSIFDLSLASPSVNDDEDMDEIEETFEDVKEENGSTTDGDALDNVAGVNSSFEHRTAISQVIN